MSRRKEPFLRRVRNAVVIIVLLPFIFPLLTLGFILFWAHRAMLYVLVWVLWLPKGKDLLVVYSDSTIWREYMLDQVIPLLHERAVVMNWSERRKWRKSAFLCQVFFSFANGREFNPVVILFRPFSRAKIFRFYQPFQDFKRGYTEPVERLRQELFASL